MKHVCGVVGIQKVKEVVMMGECVCLSVRVSMTLRLCVVDSVPEADGE